MTWAWVLSALADRGAAAAVVLGGWLFLLLHGRRLGLAGDGGGPDVGPGASVRVGGGSHVRDFGRFVRGLRMNFPAACCCLLGFGALAAALTHGS